MKKKVVVIIPARMAASRFPGKPLAKILDLPMVEHVRRRALLSEIVDEVYVATCDKVIIDAVHNFGGKAIMTSDTHERCTDRVEEAAEKVGGDIIGIVQGDEPLFMPDTVKMVLDPLLSDKKIKCTNLLSLIKNPKDFDDIDVVKAVLSKKQDVMFFSRAPIPYFRVSNNVSCYRQTGISGFKATFLSLYSRLKPTPLEITESIDFLRILEHGYMVRGVVTSDELFGVDRKEDIKIIEDRIKKDPLQQECYEHIVSL